MKLSKNMSNKKRFCKMNSNFSLGHIGEGGYKSLKTSETFSLGNKEIAFTSELSAQSIASTGKISFSYKESSSAPAKKLSIEIGKKPPLFSQIQKLQDTPEHSSAIKALLLKYIATLITVQEMGEKKIETVSAQFDAENKCSNLLLSEASSAQVPQEEIDEKINTVKKDLSRLASSEKTQRTFAKALNPDAIYQARKEIQEKKKEALNIGVEKLELDQAIKGDFDKLKTSCTEELVGDLKENIFGNIDQLKEKKIAASNREKNEQFLQAINMAKGRVQSHVNNLTLHNHPLRPELEKVFEEFSKNLDNAKSLENVESLEKQAYSLIDSRILTRKIANAKERIKNHAITGERFSESELKEIFDEHSENLDNAGSLENLELLEKQIHNLIGNKRLPEKIADAKGRVEYHIKFALNQGVPKTDLEEANQKLQELGLTDNFRNLPPLEKQIHNLICKKRLPGEIAKAKERITSHKNSALPQEVLQADLEKVTQELQSLDKVEDLEDLPLLEDKIRTRIQHLIDVKKTPEKEAIQQNKTSDVKRTDSISGAINMSGQQCYSALNLHCDNSLINRIYKFFSLS